MRTARAEGSIHAARFELAMREPKKSRPPPRAVKFQLTAWKAWGRMRLSTASRRTK
jgi:hypothetical protein